MPSIEEMKQFVSSRLLAKGILQEAEVKTEVAKLAAACPQAVVAEKGLTDDYAKAYWTLQTQEGGNVTDVTATTQPTAMPSTTVSAEDTKRIVDGLVATKENRNTLSASVVIESLVVDKPAPDQLIAAGTKGIINKKSWENIVAKYADKVLPDDENCPSTTNFNLLKQAAEAGTPVDVMIGAQSKRPVAVNLQIPASSGAGKQTVVMNVDQFNNYVVLNTAGWVIATDTTAGAKLRYVKEKKDKKNPNIIHAPRVVLVFTNRANASFEASRNVLPEVKEDTACKSALMFKVDTGRKKDDGVTPIYQTIRVTVNAPVHLTERLPKYTDSLGPVGKAKGAADLLTAPDAKALQSINKAQVAKIAELQSKVAQGDFETISQYGDALKAFETKAPAQGAVDL